MTLDKETLEIFFNPEPTRNLWGEMEETQNSFRKIELVQLIKTANRLEDLAFNTIHEDNSEQIKYINLYLKSLGLINQIINGYNFSFTIPETKKLNNLGVEDLNPEQSAKEILNRLENFNTIEDGEIDGRDFLKE